MKDEVATLPNAPLFSLKTLPFDLMAIGSICAIVLVFLPDLQSFTKNELTVTRDSMTFSLLAPIGLVFFRLGVACFSIFNRGSASKLFAVFAALTVLSILPHVFRVPLLLSWAHHCGYEVDHVMQGYRDTKFVFRQTGSRTTEDTPVMDR